MSPGQRRAPCQYIYISVFFPFMRFIFLHYAYRHLSTFFCIYFYQIAYIEITNASLITIYKYSEKYFHILYPVHITTLYCPDIYFDILADTIFLGLYKHVLASNFSSFRILTLIRMAKHIPGLAFLIIWLCCSFISSSMSKSLLLIFLEYKCCIYIVKH